MAVLALLFLLFSLISSENGDLATFDLSLAFDAALKETVAQLSYSELHYEYKQYESLLPKTYLSYENIVLDAVNILPKAAYPRYEDLIISTVQDNPNLHKKALNERNSIKDHTGKFAKKIYNDKEFTTTKNVLLRILNKEDKSKSEGWSADFIPAYRKDSMISESYKFEEELLKEIFVHIYTNYRQPVNTDKDSTDTETFVKKCKAMENTDSKKNIDDPEVSPIEIFGNYTQVQIVVGGFPKNPYDRTELYGDSLVSMPYDQTESILVYNRDIYNKPFDDDVLFTEYFNIDNIDFNHVKEEYKREYISICTSRYVDKNLIEYYIGTNLNAELKEKSILYNLYNNETNIILFDTEKPIETTNFKVKFTKYKSWNSIRGQPCDIIIGDQLPLHNIAAILNKSKDPDKLCEETRYPGTKGCLYHERYGSDGTHNTLWRADGYSLTVTYSAIIRPTQINSKRGNKEFKEAFNAAYWDLMTSSSSEDLTRSYAKVLYSRTFAEKLFPNSLLVQTSAIEYPEFNYIESGGLMEKILGRKLVKIAINKEIDKLYATKDNDNYFYNVMKQLFSSLGSRYSAQIYIELKGSENPISDVTEEKDNYDMAIDYIYHPINITYDIGETLLHIRYMPLIRREIFDATNNKNKLGFNLDEMKEETNIISFFKKYLAQEQIHGCYSTAASNSPLRAEKETLFKIISDIDGNPDTSIDNFDGIFTGLGEFSEVMNQIKNNDSTLQSEYNCNIFFVIPEVAVHFENVDLGSTDSKKNPFILLDNVYIESDLLVSTIFKKDNTLEQIQDLLNSNEKDDTRTENQKAVFGTTIFFFCLTVIVFVVSLWLTVMIKIAHPKIFSIRKH